MLCVMQGLQLKHIEYVNLSLCHILVIYLKGRNAFKLLLWMYVVSHDSNLKCLANSVEASVHNIMLCKYFSGAKAELFEKMLYEQIR